MLVPFQTGEAFTCFYSRRDIFLTVTFSSGSKSVLDGGMEWCRKVQTYLVAFSQIVVLHIARYGQRSSQT